MTVSVPVRFRTVCHGERFQAGAAVTAAAAEAKSSQIMAYCLLPLNHQQIRGMSTHRPFLSLPFYFFLFCILAPHCLSSFSHSIFLFSTFPLSVLSIIYKRPLHFQTSYVFFHLLQETWQTAVSAKLTCTHATLLLPPEHHLHTTSSLLYWPHRCL